MKTKVILLVEDDETGAAHIRSRLQSRGEYQVDTVATAGEALQRLSSSLPDAVLLDTTLPDLPAREVCRVMRSRPRTAGLPCIMLGRPGSNLSLVDALSLGADDFMTAPFDLLELEARLAARLRRRTQSLPPEPLIFRGVHLDANFDDVSLSVDAHPITLTRREFLLLRALVEHCNQTLTRERLLSRAWGSAAFDLRVVDSAMWKLRKKLGTAGTQIETVVGFGYRFNEPQVQPKGGAS